MIQYTVCVIYSWWFLTWDDLRTHKIYSIHFGPSITNSFYRPLDRWNYIDWIVPSTQTPFQLQQLNQHLHPLNNVYLKKSTTNNMTSLPAPVWDPKKPQGNSDRHRVVCHVDPRWVRRNSCEPNQQRPWRYKSPCHPKPSSAAGVGWDIRP